VSAWACERYHLFNRFSSCIYPRFF